MVAEYVQDNKLIKEDSVPLSQYLHCVLSVQYAQGLLIVLYIKCGVFVEFVQGNRLTSCAQRSRVWAVTRSHERDNWKNWGETIAHLPILSS